MRHESEAIAQCVVAKFRGARQENRQSRRQERDPPVEHRPGDGVDRNQQSERTENGDDLGRESPGSGPLAREPPTTGSVIAIKAG